MEMARLLAGLRLAYLFPILVLAEEWLWRGMILSALIEHKLNQYLAIAVTTLLYALNHLAVAPVALEERLMMAAMALPIGMIGGYLVVRTKSVWSSVAMHAILMISMIADIYLLPQLV